MSAEPRERLRRLLFLVPWVARNPGRPVDEVASVLGVTRSELLDALELLTLVGRPPFEPDDLVDIYVEDDRVYVDLAQRLSAPPRLTAAEGAALAAAARLLGPLGADTLASALAKLERVLPPQAVERFRELSSTLDVAEPPSGLAQLSAAIAAHREVRFDYFAATSGQRERRRVQPRGLYNRSGQWYLSGFDVGRGAERLFRVDRMGPVEILEVVPPASSGPMAEPRPLPAAPPLEPVRVVFSPTRASWVREHFPEVRSLPDGRVEVSVPGDNVRWLAGWVLSFGGDARVSGPAWAVRSVADAARASLD